MNFPAWVSHEGFFNYLYALRRRGWPEVAGALRAETASRVQEAHQLETFILAIDQGTSSSRALVFDSSGNLRGLAQQEFTQHFPRDGWVEHDAGEIWQTTLASCRGALRKAGVTAGQLACIGITNQRETTVIWDRATGEPVHRAIVWQDRRTAGHCQDLRQSRVDEAALQTKTGLLLDPYFSATKLQWLLNEVPGLRERAERGELAAGTVDSFLLWKLTGGRSHRTDASNASRTMLFNIETQDWDPDLLDLFEVPRQILPEVLDSAADFGTSEPDLLGGAVPITGVLGDQQAAAFGQCCFGPGAAKSTYGTGCFLLMHTGDKPVYSRNRLLTTVAYRLEGRTSYAVEGSIFMAGATMQWLRDKLKLIRASSESETLAAECAEDSGVVMVPAFTGLGAPHWDPNARGAIFGMTRDTGIPEIVTAALLSVCHQTRDLTGAIAADGVELNLLRVDGGMVANDFFLQNLADMLDCQVHRPVVTETTALGAACVAGLQAGVFSSLDAIAGMWRLDRSFNPRRDPAWREQKYAAWQDAVRRTLS